MLKKKTKVKVRAEKAETSVKTPPTAPTTNWQLERMKKLYAEATTIEDLEKYKFWIDTYSGLNPPVPKSMM